MSVILELKHEIFELTKVNRKYKNEISNFEKKMNDLNEKIEDFWRSFLEPHELAPPPNEKNLISLTNIEYWKDKYSADELKDLVSKQIKKLHQLGVFHGDIGYNNMVFYHDMPVFIDFETTKFVSQIKIISEEYIDIYLDYFIENNIVLENITVRDLLNAEMYTFPFLQN